MHRSHLPLLLASLLAVAPISASVVAISTPAESITAARIAKLPAKERPAWTAYLDRSQRQMRIDRAALAAERAPGMAEPSPPQESSSARSMPLHRDAAWYGTPEARHVADVILSFQTPAGGWSKNIDMGGSPRLRGESYTAGDLSRHLSVNDFDAPRDPSWNYVGTFDNDATNTELHFLALVSAATPGKSGDAYRASFVKGIHYLLDAQFPNGGWPQVWPLEGGYHDAITYNDNAVTESAETLTAVAEDDSIYTFVPAALRRRSATAARRALDCILATQIIVHGKRTIWAQQHDALTLAPTTARNFEPIALASGESSDVLLYLMHLPHPSPAVATAIRAGVDWLKSAAIYNEAWVGGRNTPGGRHLEPQPGAGPLWSRFYSIATGKPVFGDRDKTVHDTVADLSLERRNGYAWYSAGPQQALDAFAAWSPQHPDPR